MRFAIAYSKKDPAGINIIKQLKSNGFLPHIPIFDFNIEIIYAYGLDAKKNPMLKNIDFLIFASKHKSIKKQPSLSLHAPGNWRNADLGGKAGKVCLTSAFVLKYLFQELHNNAEKAKSENRLNKDYEITLECTHHGPLIEIPCCFIEIGSDENYWNDEKAGKIIAKTILSLQNYDIKKTEQWVPCIGIGGPHYCPNYNKIQLRSNYAISHITPEYVFPVNQSMLKEAEQKTSEHVKEVLIDWKGCGNSEQRQQTLELIEQSGLKYKRTSGIEK